MAKQVRSRRNRNANTNKPSKTKNRSKVGRSNLKFKNKTAPNKKLKKIIGVAKVQDARQKILQKKRKIVTDAREVLTKMAKTRDARSKLESIRSGRESNTRGQTNIKVIGNNIVQKVDRNGKISLITNKTRSTTNMNMAIQKQLGLIPQAPSQVKRLSPKRTGRLSSPTLLRKTILNNVDYGGPVNRVYDTALYKWVKPGMRSASHLISGLEPARQAMRDVMREELILASSRWPNLVAPKPLRLQATNYVDLVDEEDEEMPITSSRISLQGSKRISDVHMRLDSSPSHPTTHGILGAPKTKVVVPAGHRIVVSNLQSSVSEDDIKELFEDIGHLLSAKLVKSGVAEVIYKNLSDAQKAVDTYHNRQLDGQPMKCLLVNKRPLNHPTAAPLSKSESIRKLPLTNAPNKLVPDIGTIHKVLFQRK